MTVRRGPRRTDAERAEAVLAVPEEETDAEWDLDWVDAPEDEGLGAGNASDEADEPDEGTPEELDPDEIEHGVLHPDSP